MMILSRAKAALPNQPTINGHVPPFLLRGHGGGAVPSPLTEKKIPRAAWFGSCCCSSAVELHTHQLLVHKLTDGCIPSSAVSVLRF
ncbi:hypothetical protein U9M48_022879 [Paspalum notatum var. saurae]|uniref:Uncharacterized protein n=1 Tax=Paspalum notatum var. saurae TaxID=547442 RepID=A0AAQ3TIK8_PASNO